MSFWERSKIIQSLRKMSNAWQAEFHGVQNLTETQGYPAYRLPTASILVKPVWPPLVPFREQTKMATDKVSAFQQPSTSEVFRSPSTSGVFRSPSTWIFKSTLRNNVFLEPRIGVVDCEGGGCLIKARGFARGATLEWMWPRMWNLVESKWNAHLSWTTRAWKW